MLFITTQPQSEQLLTELVASPIIQFGACSVNPMLDDWKIEFYATEDLALDDWPDAQIWDWE